MRTELLVKLEKNLLEFLDEASGEYFIQVKEEQVLAKIVADIIESINNAYDTGIEDESS